MGLYYYKARMYNPSLGRFMQSDPIGYRDDVDLYTYVGNDPIDEEDPTGTCKNPEGGNGKNTEGGGGEGDAGRDRRASRVSKIRNLHHGIRASRCQITRPNSVPIGRRTRIIRILMAQSTVIPRLESRLSGITGDRDFQAIEGKIIGITSQREEKGGRNISSQVISSREKASGERWVLALFKFSGGAWRRGFVRRRPCKRISRKLYDV